MKQHLVEPDNQVTVLRLGNIPARHVNLLHEVLDNVGFAHGEANQDPECLVLQKVNLLLRVLVRREAQDSVEHL